VSSRRRGAAVAASNVSCRRRPVSGADSQRSPVHGEGKVAAEPLRWERSVRFGISVA
jgi:hypothetical protein